MKKLLLLALTSLALTTASSFGDALMFAVKSTPYDGQMSRIRPIIASAKDSGESHVSLNVVNSWMADLRSIPYGFTQAWKTPAETESGAPADCKAKAVDLYEKMTSRGAKNVRLVIGRRTPTSRCTHAWLSWETNEGTFLLDPTFNYSAAKTAQIGDRNYVPLYAYAGNRKFRAANGLVAQN